MRLIDADKLVAEYFKLTEMADKRNLDDYVSGMITVGMLIQNQPTAYDVEKVLNELEALNPVDYGSIYSYEGHSCAREMKRDAIDIVERGGVDE